MSCPSNPMLRQFRFHRKMFVHRNLNAFFFKLNFCVFQKWTTFYFQMYFELEACVEICQRLLIENFQQTQRLLQTRCQNAFHFDRLLSQPFLTKFGSRRNLVLESTIEIVS
jgi:hypothetical protein